MLSLEFAPDYATSGRFYLNFTGVAGDGTANNGDLHIDEFTDADTSDDVATGAVRRKLLTIPHDLEYSHNGGTIQINPQDGQLWVSVGDGGVGGDACHNGQTINDVPYIPCDVNENPLLGKMLRINPDVGTPYSTSPGQPFTAGGVTAKNEIFAYGLRNPFRWSFDRLTGDMIIGDVGENNYEELDFVPQAQLQPGLNFGWNTYEGRHDFPGGAPLFGNADTKPVYEYTHAVGCSVIGGYVDRDETSALYGQYLFGDFCEGKVQAACLSATGATDVRDLGLPQANINSFGEDASGRIYVVRFNGNVSRIVATGDEGSCPVPGGGSGSPPGIIKTVVPKRGSSISKIRFVTRQPVAKRGYVTVTATCDVACALTAQARFKVAGNTHRMSGRTLNKRLKKGKATKLKIKLSPTTRNAIRRALLTGRRTTVTVTLKVPGSSAAVAKVTISG